MTTVHLCITLFPVLFMSQLLRKWDDENDLDFTARHGQLHGAIHMGSKMTLKFGIW